MKKVMILMATAAMMAVSCQDSKKVPDVSNLRQTDSLQSIIAQKDNEINDMLTTLNEIQEGFRQIAQAESRVDIVKDGEGTNKKQQIRENIKFISSTMQRNRELIAKLRQQVREGSVKGEALKATIDNMTKMLEEKDVELQKLRSELDQKDIHIAELDETINNLNTNVKDLKNESQQRAQTIQSQDKQLHTAWYVFGTKKELKDQHILADGKVLQQNFNKNYFTKIDIRVDREVKFYNKSAKLLTPHPASSYTLTRDANKQYVLRITNPDIFWSTSKYLVVLVK